MKLFNVVSAMAMSLLAGSALMADVTGKVTFDGKPPERKKVNMTSVAQCAAIHKEPVLDQSLVVDKAGGVASAVISIKNPPAGGKVPAEPAVLDQKGCMYIPYVLPMMVGQQIVVKNSDPFLHNVHGLPEENTGFNFGQNNIDPGRKLGPMKVAETFRVKCDVHPWMVTYFVVMDHPYFATTKEDGTFSLKGLPDGDYEVVAWHPKLGEQEGKVSVKSGNGTVDFKMKLEEEAAIPTKDVLKALTAGGSDCCTNPTAIR